jgi:rubredoxin
MCAKEVKGNPYSCPYCGSERVSYNGEVEMEDPFTELSVNFYCLDCSNGYDSIFVFAGRLFIEE